LEIFDHIWSYNGDLELGSALKDGMSLKRTMKSYVRMKLRELKMVI